MLRSKSFLAVDFGAGSVKLAEFEINEAGGLRLIRYGVKPFGIEGSQDTTREGVIRRALHNLLMEKGIKAKDINACAPGYHVFSKFVKLPPVDNSKVTQIIQYEAQQNVPFPLEEVVWDYQILGSTAKEEMEVLLVAIKIDVVEGLFRVAESEGVRLQLVDVSPAALSNAFRYNYGDLENQGCSMLLDIGAKTSNLLFFEQGKVYARSINIGANSITQDFAAEAKLKFNDAEAVKLEKGFVSLGGAYEEPDDPQAAAISKIARQVMTRLHIQVNQTVQFYRGQQGGSAPQRLFLCGGASIMPYAPQFFAEKLSVPVDFFNPFRNVQIDSSVNLEELAKVAHTFGEIVGLGLRNLAHCPVEMNLMPKSSLKRLEFQQKKPYFIASIYGVAAIVVAFAYFNYRGVADREEALEKLKRNIDPMLQKEAEMRRALGAMEQSKKEVEKLVALSGDRFYWNEVVMELRRILKQTEDKIAQKTGADAGVWLEVFSPQLPAMDPNALPQTVASSLPMGTGQSPDGPPPGEGNPDTVQPQPAQSSVSTLAPDDVAIINVVCRGVDMDKTNPTANSDLAYELKAGVAASPLFLGESTVLEQINKSDDGMTFTVGMKLQLKRPLKFKYGMD